MKPAYQLKAIIEEANKVAGECFKACDDLSDFSIREARLAEDKFEMKHQESWKKYATLTYELWSKNKELWLCG